MFFVLFLLRKIQQIAVGMSYIEIQPTFSHLSPSSLMVRASHRRSKSCGFESRLGTRSKNSSKNIMITIFTSELAYLLTLIIILPISDHRFLFTNNPRGAQRCYNNELISTAIHSSWRQCSRNDQRSKRQKHQYGSGTNEPYKRPLDLACKSIEIVKNLFSPQLFSHLL